MAEELLRVWPDLGAMLKVGRSKAYDLVASGEIRVVKIGSKITRVHHDDVVAFIEAHKTGAPAGTSS